MFIIGQIASKKSEHHILWCTILTFFSHFLYGWKSKMVTAAGKSLDYAGKKV
jgi:hypothetical protein